MKGDRRPLELLTLSQRKDVQYTREGKNHGRVHRRSLQNRTGLYPPERGRAGTGADKGVAVRYPERALPGRRPRDLHTGRCGDTTGTLRSMEYHEVPVQTAR